MRNVARVRRRGGYPTLNLGSVYGIYLAHMGRQGILCLLSVENGMGVAT